MRTQECKFECPTDEIAAYIDGELSAAREVELDAHFTHCRVCSEELNQQKLFLRVLDASLSETGEVDLPADFAKKVAANAESTVSGLRRPRERFNALFICAGLFLFVLFALGTDAGRIFSGAATLFEQATAVGSFFGHLVYSFFLGIAIIVRSLTAQVRVEQAASPIFAAAAITLILILFISRKALRIRRA
jgi:anti-sigma factor RsiW